MHPDINRIKSIRLQEIYEAMKCCHVSINDLMKYNKKKEGE